MIASRVVRPKFIPNRMSLSVPDQMAIAPTHESGLCLPNLQPVWHHKRPRRLVEKCPADDIYQRLEGLAGSFAFPQETRAAATSGQ